MIKEVHIIHRDSGVPLVHVDLFDLDDHLNVPSAMFSGALQGIRSFLREANIGDLTKFMTEENKIEVKMEEGVVVAIVADRKEPSDQVVEDIADDLGELFVRQYKGDIKDFDGDIAKFDPFITEVENYIRVIEEEGAETDQEIEVDKSIAGKKAQGTLKSHLKLLFEWVKNRYEPDAEIDKNVLICCPPDKEELSVDILLEGGKRKMNRIDSWLGKRMAKGGIRNIVFVIELGPSHGPAQIRKILEKVLYLGDPDYTDDSEIYPWFPSEIALFGANLNKDSFYDLEDIITTYKGEHIIVPYYAGHIHREHSPHHAFYRCKISGWRWNQNPITIDNVPVQIFP
jgi:hypothetical protein